MNVISITKARANIYKILAEVNAGSEPVMITNSRGKNGVLLSEESWNSIQETLYLKLIPGVTDRVLKEGGIPGKDCRKEGNSG